MFFKHFTSKNQLFGFYISRISVENGLKANFFMLQKQYFANKLTGFCIMEISAINKVISFLDVF